MHILALNFFDDIIGISIWLTVTIYHVAAWIFQVFLILASGQLVDQSTYSLVIQNFYIVIGIAVLFFVSFSLLKGLVNPDEKSSGTSVVKTTIINLVTSVAIMAILPTVFGFLYDFQTSFITRYNVIGRFFGYGELGEPVDDKTSSYLCKMNNEEVKRGAFSIVNGVFTAFFNVNPDNCEKLGVELPIDDNAKLLECQEKTKDADTILFFTRRSKGTFAEAISDVNKYGEFTAYIDFAENVRMNEISFNFILAVLAGLLLIYVGFSFCFDLAFRAVRLVFYQIIAPIPIFSRVIPEGSLKGLFDKWVKIVITVYLEVFIRIFTFYFAVYLCMALLRSKFIDSIFGCGFNPIVAILTRAFVLMGIITFMRQAPKLISEVIGFDSSGMSLGIRNKLRDGGFFAAGSILGSSVTAGVRNFMNARKDIKNRWSSASGFRGKARLIAGGAGSVLGGGISGLVRGGRAGWTAGSFEEMRKAAGRGAKEVVDARNRRASYRARHPGEYGVIMGRIDDAYDTVQRWAGIKNIQELNEEKSSIQKVVSSMDAVTDATKNMLRNEINAKGKEWSFGIDPTSAKGKASVTDAITGRKFDYAFTAKNYKAMSDALDRAKTSGEKVDFYGDDGRLVGSYTADQLQRMFGKYESDYSKAIANQLLKSEADYNALLADLRRKHTDGGVFDAAKYYDEKALLDSQRGIAETFKHDLDRAIGSGFIDIANTQAVEIDSGALQINSGTVNGSLEINSGAIDRIGAAAKQRIGEIDAEVSKIQQREEER